MKLWPLAACLCLVTTARCDADRLSWWREARFAMFIHWGVYSIPARGEWVMHSEKIKIADYEKFSWDFKPDRYDADAWVQLAQAAGQKYMVITTKHHDGFCNFDSKLTDYDAVDRGPKRDLIRELVDACHRHGMRIGFYYSLLDWHHPDYGPGRPGGGVPGDFNKYREYLFGQVRELLTNYGKVDVMWFDGGWEHSAAEWHSDELIAMIRQLQPDIVINNRANVPADYETPEQTIPGAAMRGRLWETCMTINGSWGYNRGDHNDKSVETLIHNLCDIASKGGNFLLNVGPTELGEILPEQQERLRAMGDWLKVNGEAIYGTEASPFAQTPPWGRITMRGNTLYLHVFQAPDGPLALDRLKTRVASASLLGGAAVPIRVDEHGTTVLDLPAGAVQGPATVVKVDLVAPPVVDTTIHPGGGVFQLKAREATVHGSAARYEEGGGKDNIGFWTNAEDTVSWDLAVPAAGDYNVELTYASDVKGARFVVRCGASEVVGGVAHTGGWASFVTVQLGRLHLDAGEQTVTVVPTEMPGFAVMNLQAIKLTPAQ